MRRYPEGKIKAQENWSMTDAQAKKWEAKIMADINAGRTTRIEDSEICKRLSAISKRPDVNP